MPALISSRGGQVPNRNNSTMSNEDIQNDMILRESAYIADQLLKKLAPAQPVFHHTELMPIRQNRAEAPTAQIPSPETSPLIQKPPPPQLASMRSKMHFNNNLPIPQLSDAKYLQRKPARIEDDIDPVSGDKSRDTTDNDEYINLQTATHGRFERKPGFRPAREHIPTPGPGSFPYFPSQRLAPPVPSKISATAQAMGVYQNYQHQHQQQKRRNNVQVESHSNKMTGKRRPGQGVTIGTAGHITVPVIGPPPPEKRWRYKSREKSKRSDAVHREYSMQRRDSEPGWEEVQVRGGQQNSRDQDQDQNGCGYGGVSRAYTT